MGADIKSLRTRIRSTDSTLHLTKAMGLVASSKIRRATEGMQHARAYAKAVSTIITDLTSCSECKRSPFMAERNAERVKIIVIAGDRGLCGGYNVNIFRVAAECRRKYPDAEFIPIGKRAHDRFGGEFYSSETFSRDDGSAMARKLCEEFAEGRFDKLGIICTTYKNIMTQEAEMKWVLPLMPSKKSGSAGVVFEPDEVTIFNTTVPEYITGIILHAVRESFACEVTARRMAMDSAGKNAEEMIASLQLQYNRARQSAITQEITEIVAGSGS